MRAPAGVVVAVVEYADEAQIAGDRRRNPSETPTASGASFISASNPPQRLDRRVEARRRRVGCPVGHRRFRSLGSAPASSLQDTEQPGECAKEPENS